MKTRTPKSSPDRALDASRTRIACDLCERHVNGIDTVMVVSLTGLSGDGRRLRDSVCCGLIGFGRS